MNFIMKFIFFNKRWFDRSFINVKFNKERFEKVFINYLFNKERFDKILIFYEIYDLISFIKILSLFYIENNIRKYILFSLSYLFF